MTSTAHRPKAVKSPSATQIADELSVLRAPSSIDDAIENMHSDDPELQASGQAQLQAMVDREGDLRTACNRIIASAKHDQREAAKCAGEIEHLNNEIVKVKQQQNRYLRKASRKQVYACSLLDTYFPDEKTHPTPWKNIGMQKLKPAVVNQDGCKLRLDDITPGYEWLISKQEKTTTVKVIDEQKILDGLAKGETFEFARLKENSVRFY